MKPSISKLFPAVCAALWLAACSDSSDPKPAPQPAAPAATVQEPAAKPQPAEQQKPAEPQKTAPAKKQPAAVPNMTAAQLTERLKQWDKNLNTLETDFEQKTAYIQ